MKSTAVYVPCNLSEKSWKEKLIDSGYSRNRKTFASLLGISYYLSKEDFESLLINISDSMMTESSICFDYPSVDESRETKTNQMLASGAGEQMKAVYSYQEIESLLQRCGFELKEHLNHSEMTRLFFEEYNEATHEHQIQAPVGVEYALAVKKNT